MIKKPLTIFKAIFGISTSYLLTYLKIRKIEGHFWSPSIHPSIHPSVHPHNKGFWPNFFGGLPVQNWNSILRSLMTINHKKINWTPSGVLSHFPSGDKGFQDFKKADQKFGFWNLNFGSSNTYKMERPSSGPSRALLLQFPSGDKCVMGLGVRGLKLHFNQVRGNLILFLGVRG